eukprot:679981-Pleurochrysis_carterae.AAC.4
MASGAGRMRGALEGEGESRPWSRRGSVAAAGAVRGRDEGIGGAYRISYSGKRERFQTRIAVCVEQRE